MRKWDHISANQALNYARVLRRVHNPELTMKLVEYFHERIQDGEPYSKDALEVFVQPMFDRLLSPKKCSPAVALGLKPGQGKYPRDKDGDRAVKTTAIVVQLMRQGLNKEDAITDAAEIMRISNETVSRDISDHLGIFEAFPDEALNGIFPLD